MSESPAPALANKDAVRQTSTQSHMERVLWTSSFRTSERWSFSNFRLGRAKLSPPSLSFFSTVPVFLARKLALSSARATEPWPSRSSAHGLHKQGYRRTPMAEPFQAVVDAINDLTRVTIAL